jgi:uncharacterized protein (TIGR02246 family)
MRGTRVHSDPVGIRPVNDQLILVVTQGGVLAPGESQLAPERSLRASWVFTRSGADWLVAAYHRSRLACGARPAIVAHASRDLH